MSRNKRKTSAWQAIAVTTICVLFIMTALVGLYKCFSQEPTLEDMFIQYTGRGLS